MKVFMRNILKTLSFLLCGIFVSSAAAEEAQWISFGGGEGPGVGKHIVLVSGDEEYRSEESLPMLAKVLSLRFGFKTTVLFAINKKTGEIDPNVLDNIPGLEALKTADLMIVNLRFRNLPDEQMKYIDEYLQSAKPVIGIRPSLVAFKSKPSNSKYFKYSCRKTKKGGLKEGFGLDYLGTDWVAHHGRHKKESTLGLPVESMKKHPIMRGVGKMWGPTDVYRINTPIPGVDKVLVMGQVLKGMKGTKYSPKAQMPLAWTKHFQTPNGKGKSFMSTMGDGKDFEDENFRRMIVNASFWAVGLEDKISASNNVKLVGTYKPLPFGFNKFKRGAFPKDHLLPVTSGSGLK